MSSIPKIKAIYTDGSCLKNPGPGGWGVVIYFSDGSTHEMGEASSYTTNNKMEIQAAIAALKFLKASGQTNPITLYSDSKYLIRSLTEWMEGWKENNWIKFSDGKPVLNQDLLKQLDSLNSPQVRWQHVRGHCGNRGNERADKIANAFARGTAITLKQIETTMTSAPANTQQTQITLQYFKETGKFYTEGTLELLPEEINSDGIALMFKISDRVRNLSKEKKLPGIIGDWIQLGGYIYIYTEVGYPCLIKQEFKYKLVVQDSSCSPIIYKIVEVESGREVAHDICVDDSSLRDMYNYIPGQRFLPWVETLDELVLVVRSYLAALNHNH